MKPTDTPARNDANAIRQIEGTVFVMNPDTSELHSFNDVGRRIWELVDGARTVAAITDVITAEFEVDGPTARIDVLEFLANCRAKTSFASKPAHSGR